MPIAQVVKAAESTLISFDGVRQLLHDAYKLECSVVTFVNARLVNGRVVVVVLYFFEKDYLIVKR